MIFSKFGPPQTAERPSSNELSRNGCSLFSLVSRLFTVPFPGTTLTLQELCDCDFDAHALNDHDFFFFGAKLMVISMTLTFTLSIMILTNRTLLPRSTHRNFVM